MKKTTIAPSQVVRVNGPRQQKGMAPLEPVRMSEEALRKLDHPEWLESFAKVMQMQTRVEMTPMRAGIINRSLMAAEYIRLLRNDIRVLTKRVEEYARVAPSAAGPSAGANGGEEVRSEHDEAFDNPHHGHRDDDQGR